MPVSIVDLMLVSDDRNSMAHEELRSAASQKAFMPKASRDAAVQ